MQTSMTNARLQVQIAESKGDAEIALAKRQNDRAIMLAAADGTDQHKIESSGSQKMRR